MKTIYCLKQKLSIPNFSRKLRNSECMLLTNPSHSTAEMNMLRNDDCTALLIGAMM